jgi:hypothetical protein
MQMFQGIIEAPVIAIINLSSEAIRITLRMDITFTLHVPRDVKVWKASGDSPRMEQRVMAPSAHPQLAQAGE